MAMLCFLCNPQPRYRERKVGKRERQREGGRERNINMIYKRNIGWLPPVCVLSRDQTCDLGWCPDGESDPQTFGVWDGMTEPPSWGRDFCTYLYFPIKGIYFFYSLHRGSSH